MQRLSETTAANTADQRSPVDSSDELPSDVLKSLSDYQKKLVEVPLFRNSLWERFLAQSVPFLTHFCRCKKPVKQSRVVSQLTLWERFLSHRLRTDRMMRLCVNFHNRSTSCSQFHTLAAIELTQQILNHTGDWENQPLNVTVSEKSSQGCLDPRVSMGNELRVKMIHVDGTQSMCTIDLSDAKTLSEADLALHVSEAVKSKESLKGPASVVLDCRADSKFEKTYTDDEGAWLRIGLDPRGGLIATADHLVLDGNLFQQLILKLAQSLAQVPRQDKIADHHDADVHRVRVENVPSISILTHQILNALSDCGFQLQTGKESLMLATIDDASPSARSDLPKHQRRILPLIMCLKGTSNPAEIKRRVQDLNSYGWSSLGPHVWDRLYSGYVHRWVLRYLESMAPHVPFQDASRFLAGTVLLSFLPPPTNVDLCPTSIESLSLQTIAPPFGAPVITVMQLPKRGSHERTAFITINGSGKWSQPDKLNELRSRIEFHTVRPQCEVPTAISPL